MIWLSNLSILSVPDEVYIQKRVVRTEFDIYVFIYVCLMFTNYVFKGVFTRYL